MESGDKSFDENVLKLLSILFNAYEPPPRVAKDHAGAHTYASVSSLFLSIADMFDGLAKDVDIMEGEVLFHEKLNGMRKHSRIAKRARPRRAMTFYKEDLGVGIPSARLKEMWKAESEETREKYRRIAERHNKRGGR